MMGLGWRSRQLSTHTHPDALWHAPRGLAAQAMWFWRGGVTSDPGSKSTVISSVSARGRRRVQRNLIAAQDQRDAVAFHADHLERGHILLGHGKYRGHFGAGILRHLRTTRQFRGYSQNAVCPRSLSTPRPLKTPPLLVCRRPSHWQIRPRRRENYRVARGRVGWRDGPDCQGFQAKMPSSLRRCTKGAFQTSLAWGFSRAFGSLSVRI